jgi:hypothetical protein
VNDRSDDHFDVNVEELRSRTREHLGASIRYLAETASLVRRTEDNDGAFEGGDGLFSNVTSAWANARIGVNGVLADNVETLELSRTALFEIADRYEAVDLGSAATFNRIANEG